MPKKQTTSERTVGQQIQALTRKLYPICRSITGSGVRETLAILKKEIPLAICEVSSGMQVFDWTVPEEWNIRDAYVKDEKGKRIIDFQKHNLHVVNYSAPVKKTMTLAELTPHLYTLPKYPDSIPYRTTYYDKTWGFCLTHNKFKKLKPGKYEVVIDSTLKKGSLTYGEYVIKGETTDEILISTHVCHPSLANDNLSGIAVAVSLAKALAKRESRYTYRFLFIPGTIGSLVWLRKNKKRLKRIKNGLVLTGVGDAGELTYKKTRQGDREIDRIFTYLLSQENKESNIRDFTPFGYDERQYNAPGFNLPVGTLMRTPHGEYPEYHTSADNLDFVKPASLANSYETVLEAIEITEANQTYLNTSPYGEPQLGKRGIYRAMNQESRDVKEFQMAMLWILNLSDGKHDLLAIAAKSGIAFELIKNAADILAKHKLLKKLE